MLSFLVCSMKKMFWIDTIPYVYPYRESSWLEDDLHRSAKRVYAVMAQDFTDAHAYLAPTGHSYTEANEGVPLVGNYEWDIEELSARTNVENLDEALALLSEMKLVTY